MSLPHYLNVNADRIKKRQSQNLGAWDATYDHSAFDDFQVIKDLRSRFPNKTIHRADVVNLFQEGHKYLAFFAAMVWGHINASRPRIKGGDRKTTNLYRALTHPESKIIKSIDYAESCLLRNDFISPFRKMMQDKENSVPGVGYRYFTKIFFFIGQANANIKVKPLILDKWTSNAFYALLAQVNPDDVCKYFREIKDASNKDHPGEVIVRSGHKLFDAYDRYVKEMNDWSGDLSVEPARLEEFVFGADLRQGIKSENPRVELWGIIKANQHLIRRPRPQ
jgi:hypothetical protein